MIHGDKRKDEIQPGDTIHTPRFLSVIIQEVLDADEALAEGYTEPTHYDVVGYDIYGKSLGLNRMVFAAVRKKKDDLALPAGGYMVQITETLKMTVEVSASEAGSREEARSLVEKNWRNSEYILDADCICGVSFEIVEGQ